MRKIHNLEQETLVGIISWWIASPAFYSFIVYRWWSKSTNLVNFLSMLAQAMITTSIESLSTSNGYQILQLKSLNFICHMHRLVELYIWSIFFFICNIWLDIHVWRLVSKQSNRERFYDFNSKFGKVIRKLLWPFTPRVAGYQGYHLIQNVCSLLFCFDRNWIIHLSALGWWGGCRGNRREGGGNKSRITPLF